MIFLKNVIFFGGKNLTYPLVILRWSANNWGTWGCKQKGSTATSLLSYRDHINRWISQNVQIDKNFKTETGSGATKPARLLGAKAASQCRQARPQVIWEYFRGEKSFAHLKWRKNMILLLLLLLHCCCFWVYFPCCNWLASSSLDQFGFLNLVS